MPEAPIALLGLGHRLGRRAHQAQRRALGERREVPPEIELGGGHALGIRPRGPGQGDTRLGEPEGIVHGGPRRPVAGVEAPGEKPQPESRQARRRVHDLVGFE